MLLTIIVSICLLLFVIINYSVYPDKVLPFFLEGGLLALVVAFLYQNSYNLAFLTTIKEQGSRILIFTVIMYIVYMLMRAILPQSITALMYSLTAIGLTFGNIVKIKSREEPFIWNDIRGGTSLIKEVVWDMILKQHTLLVIVGLVVVSGLVILFFKRHRDNLSLKNRLILLAGSTFLMFFFLNNTNMVLAKIGAIVYPNNNEANLKTNGPGLTFFFSKEGTIMQEIDGYNQKKMTELVTDLEKRYESTTMSKNKEQPTFIYILSEALFDPTLVEGTIWKEDPMPTIRKLQQQNGGQMLANVFGGGTANTEYSTLTNISHELLNAGAVPYAYMKENNERAYSSIPAFKENGYQTLAIHSYTATSYNRPEVFNLLSIDSFLSETEIKAEDSSRYYTEGYMSDQSFYQAVLSNLNDSPQLIHTISMQNHFPYDIDRKGKLQESENLLENIEKITNGEQLATYARGLKKTDNEVAKFIESLEKIDKEVYVVLYGDHLPALDKEFYDANNISSNKNQNIAKFLTPYIIWNNKGKGVKTQQIVNPEFMTLQAHQASNTLYTTFQKFAYDLSQKLPAFDLNTATYFVEGEELSEDKLDVETKQMLNDYQLIMYDILSGKQYSSKLFNEKLQKEEIKK